MKTQNKFLILIALTILLQGCVTYKKNMKESNNDRKIIKNYTLNNNERN